MIQRGLKVLRLRSVAGCVLLGEPGFYRRFGFGLDEDLRYEGAPREFFMRLNLAGNETPAGKVEYHPAFNGG